MANFYTRTDRTSGFTTRETNEHHTAAVATQTHTMRFYPRASAANDTAVILAQVLCRRPESSQI